MRFIVIPFLSAVGVRFGFAGRRDNLHKEPETCRIAVCFSGHVRSFVYPVVHHSARRHLVDALAKKNGCRVDVFAYATLSDDMASFKTESGENEFTPSVENVKRAFDVLQPTRVVWHQDMTGIIPNDCQQETTPGQFSSNPDHRHGRKGKKSGKIEETTTNKNGHDEIEHSRRWWHEHGGEATESLYWQLYKSLAAFRMAKLKEESEGFQYDWVVRTRFDLVWFRPFPSLRSFGHDAVWLGADFWPISDPFALVPRRLAKEFFMAISSYYACDGESWPPSEDWWRASCTGGGFEESVLLRHMCSRNTPHRLFSLFEYEIVRGGRVTLPHAGVTKPERAAYIAACDIIGAGGMFRPGYSSLDCMSALSSWAELRTWTLLSLNGLWGKKRAAAIIDPDPRAWEKLIRRPSDDQPTESVEPQNLQAPGVLDLDRVRAQLQALSRGLRVGNAGNVDDDWGEMDGTQDGEQRQLAPSPDGVPPYTYVYSPPGCPFGKHPGRAPHRVGAYDPHDEQIRELTLVIKCFADSFSGRRPDKSESEHTRPQNGTTAEGRHETRDDDASSRTHWDTGPDEEFLVNSWGENGSYCGSSRSLEQVMLDISKTAVELGICTADGSDINNGTSSSSDRPWLAQVADFFRQPEEHCVWYHNLRLTDKRRRKGSPEQAHSGLD